MAETEITVGEFRRFIKATGYAPTSSQTRKSTVYDENTGTLAERNGIIWENDHAGNKADDNLPVIHVSWLDTQAYTEWLSRETGKRRSEEHTSELQSLMRISYAVFCLKKNKQTTPTDK